MVLRTALDSVVFMALMVYLLLGLVIYGAYDFTNYSTLRQWPFALMLADVAWHTAATVVSSTTVPLLVRT